MCDHDIIDITVIGDTYRRGLCRKCNRYFVGGLVRPFRDDHVGWTIQRNDANKPDPSTSAEVDGQ